MEDTKMRFNATENEQLLETVARKRLERTARHRPVTQDQVVHAVRAILAHTEARTAEGRETFSFTRAIRGMMAIKGEVVDTASAEDDVAYARALQSGTTPGSYLSPQLQAAAIISQLQQYAVARAAGARIWPVIGGLTLNVPSGITAPTVVWTAQNSKQSPDSAANFGQASFTLKQQSALLLIPLQLLRTSKPVFDVILGDSFALAVAEAEDVAMFASSQVANAPAPLLAASGITTINTGSSANGGNLAYSDVLAVMLKAAQLKMKPPFAWFCSPRTLYTRLLGLQDTTSRPLLIPDVSDPATSGYSLMGFPLFVTASISEAEALGSGSNQSHLILAAPRAIHIAQDEDVSMTVGLEAYLDSAQAGLRIGHQVDFAYAPASSLIALLGVN
jgi:HK97 family phage major capsid protein